MWRKSVTRIIAEQNHGQQQQKQHDQQQQQGPALLRTSIKVVPLSSLRASSHPAFGTLEADRDGRGGTAGGGASEQMHADARGRCSRAAFALESAVSLVA